MTKEDTLYDKLINRNKYNILRNYLEFNKNDIIKALNNKVMYKDIYYEFIESNKLDIKYNWFCQILSEFKIKHIYNISEEAYKKQIEAITQTEKKEDEMLSSLTPPAQPKDIEKVETKKDVPADEKPSGKIPKWKEAGFNNIKEYFEYLKNQPKAPPKEKEHFIWKPT